jgi:serine/threonine protein kinase
MALKDPSPFEELTPQELQCLERACDAFERAWQAGQRPSIEQFLAEAPERVRPELLGNLLDLEVAYRQRQGEKTTLAEYEKRFPDHFGRLELVEQRRRRTPRIPAPPPSTEDPFGATAPGAAGLTPAGWPAVPGYEILAELGRGGMGVVYKAKQVAARRLVALKMIRDGVLAGPEQRVRFRIEAEAAARCQHPNLVRIYEVGEHAGLHYFSMELAEGGSLTKSVAGRQLPQAEAARLVQTLAEAVGYAHDKKIVHRDLKPANVVLTADGRPLITDFGLAKRLDSDTALTGSAAVLGTAGYMAPEQAAGQARHVGPAADVYALGAILYELLTGQPPFRAESWETAVRQVLHEEPTPPGRLRPDLATDLENVCLKCLEKEPGQRYAGARGLAEDLGRFLAGQSVLAAPAADWERQARWARQAGFEIEDVLTHGVRDVVYRARQTHLNREVALKVVTAPALAGPAARDRLRREAEVVARLDHPNIVRIYSSGELHGRTYLAFEYVAGGSLIERVVDQAMPPRQAAQLVQQLAQAIHYAHQRGVLHCALKPSNVLLTADGVPKITNFGLSILLEEPASERRLAFRRLADYLAPELVDGRADEVGPATDVYALGAVLYKLLTGDPPFVAETVAATAALVRSRPAPPPSAVRGEVPAALDTICLRCLAKHPWHRLASAGELAEELGRFLAADSPAGKIPSPVGGYEVLRVLGQGSMSIVYEVREMATGRPLALKMMQPEFHHDKALRDRLREVAARVAQVRHPNIVEVYDCREQYGVPYFLMELVPGGSLNRQRPGRPGIPESVALVRTLASALEVPHRQGIVHGNLKPSKVLFAADGTPKVTGFIIARQEYAPVMMTGRGVLGTPSYMAPEQLTGNIPAIGPATDVYALGLILYEQVTGWLPYRAVTFWDMMAQILREPPQPPRELCSDLPPELESVCLRCLAKDPQQRYASAGALAEALEPFVAGELPGGACTAAPAS